MKLNYQDQVNGLPERSFIQTSLPIQITRAQVIQYAGLVFMATLTFSALFAAANLVQYNWLSPRYEQAANPTTWGILQRLWLIVPGALIAWRWPKRLGFQVGKIFQYWKILAVLLALNVAVVGGYTWLSGGTPYSGLTMIVNEVITVPLVEEVIWRGVVFAVLLAALSRVMNEGQAGMTAAIFSGVCFGLLHATNALAGYNPAFVALQTLNATVWGVIYGIARAKTGSLYPSLVLHAAMNLSVALL